MRGWREILAHYVVGLEDRFDRFKYGLRERLGRRRSIMIQPYRGFGKPDRIYVKGRVLEDKGITPAGDRDSIWINLVNMYRRFESDEIPFARVQARVQDIRQETIADEEGYFEFWLDFPRPLTGTGLWRMVDLELLEPRQADRPPARTAGEALMLQPEARFGVISDIDDTVIRTNATHLLLMARTVFLGNARTRLPFKGVAAFYRALMEGISGSEMNPLFYISSSPWNIYDLLSDFFQLQGIPLGPVLLRDYGISKEEIQYTGHEHYKMMSIRKVLDFYKELPFILLGDSGQNDPEIYTQVVSLYPQRILGVYIRDVSLNLKRTEQMKALTDQVLAGGSTLVVARDTHMMAEHAARQGWISPAELPFIQAEEEADQASPSPVDKLLGKEKIS